MASKRSNSSSSRSSQRKKPARKAVKKSAKRKSARKKPATRKSPARKRKPVAKKRSFLFKLIFWPFMLVAYFTRNWHPIFRLPARAIGYVAVMLTMCCACAAAFYGFLASRYDMAKVTSMPARTLIYARDGKTELGRLHGDNRYIVKYDQVSEYFKNALISREDTRFYSHFGIDPRSVARATVQNIKRRRFAQGGSTLSIQLAENTETPVDRI